MKHLLIVSWIRNSVNYKVGFDTTYISSLRAVSQPHLGEPQVLTWVGKDGVYPEAWQIVFSTQGIYLWTETKGQIWSIPGILS